MVFVMFRVLNESTNGFSKLFTFHNDVISRFTLFRSFITMGDDVGIFGDSNGCFFNVTGDHSDDDTGLFAFVDGFRDAFFEWVLDSCQTQNDQRIFIEFRLLVFGLFFSQFFITNE